MHAPPIHFGAAPLVFHQRQRAGEAVEQRLRPGGCGWRFLACDLQACRQNRQRFVVDGGHAVPAAQNLHGARHFALRIGRAGAGLVPGVQNGVAQVVGRQRFDVESRALHVFQRDSLERAENLEHPRGAAGGRQLQRLAGEIARKIGRIERAFAGHGIGIVVAIDQQPRRRIGDPRHSAGGDAFAPFGLARRSIDRPRPVERIVAFVRRRAIEIEDAAMAVGGDAMPLVIVVGGDRLEIQRPQLGQVDRFQPCKAHGIGCACRAIFLDDQSMARPARLAADAPAAWDRDIDRLRFDPLPFSFV
ncbi:MAG: hypothetical protein BWZ10_02627 [candidate division BRC1 bacterium ADurb.BinA364]|nr:MAG: hypothetical protein BWZ10_02627 [candidate division BRC1 bacterium ADurb.BinA364]